jgi:hypothetical protein
MKPNELKQGKVYFSCAYSNPKYPVPEIETYVYIEKNVSLTEEATEQAEYIFEDPRKYFERELLSGLSEEEKVHYEPPAEPTRSIFHEGGLNLIHDINGLIQFLEKSKKEPGAKDIFE